MGMLGKLRSHLSIETMTPIFSVLLPSLILTLVGLSVPVFAIEGKLMPTITEALEPFISDASFGLSGPDRAEQLIPVEGMDRLLERMTLQLSDLGELEQAEAVAQKIVNEELQERAIAYVIEGMADNQDVSGAFALLCHFLMKQIELINFLLVDVF